MLPPPLRPDFRLPRDWRRPWREPKGFFMPGCACCPASGQNYYCMGGFDTSGVALTQNQQWTSAWTSKTLVPTARALHAASTPTTTSSLYVYGGTDGSVLLTRSDSYDSTDTWSTNTAIPSPARKGAGGVAISSLSYSWGGQTTVASPFTATTQNDQMTPGSPSTWTTKTAMTAAKDTFAAAPISSKGYAVCGAASGGSAVNTNYEYNPSGDSWATKTACPAPAKSGVAGFSISGTVYVMYGSPDTTRRNDGYVVDSWSSFATAPTLACQWPGSASIDASSVGWTTGGLSLTGPFPTIAQHEEYTPNAWSTRTNIPTATHNPSSAIT